MTRSARIGRLWLVLLALAVPKVSAAATVVKGYLDGVFLEGTQNFIRGWACEVGANTSITVHVYAGGLAGTAQSDFVTSALANLANSPGIDTQCGFNQPGAGHRFRIPVTQEIADKYRGEKLYVYGISSSGSTVAQLSQGSGPPDVPSLLFSDSGYVQVQVDLRSDPSAGLSNATRLRDLFVANRASNVTLVLPDGTYPLDCLNAAPPYCLQFLGPSSSRTTSLNLVSRGVTRLVYKNDLSSLASYPFYFSNFNIVRMSGVQLDEQFKSYVTGPITGIFRSGTATSYVDVDCSACGDSAFDRQSVGQLVTPYTTSFGFALEGSTGARKARTHNMIRASRIYYRASPSTTVRFEFPDTENKARMEGFAVGDRFAYVARPSSAYALFVRNNQVLIDQVTLFSSSGVGLMMKDIDQRILIEGFHSEKKPNVLLFPVTANTGSLFLANNRAYATIRESSFQGSADDEVSIFTSGKPLYALSEAGSNTQLDVETSAACQVGDLIQVAHSELAQIHPSFTRGIPVQSCSEFQQLRPDGQSVTLTRYTIQGSLSSRNLDPALISGYRLFNTHRSAPRTMVKNNVFPGNRRSALMFKSYDSKIINNNFTLCDGESIRLETDLSDFSGGGIPYSVEIKNNRFSCTPTALGIQHHVIAAMNTEPSSLVPDPSRMGSSALVLRDNSTQVELLRVIRILP